MSNKPLKRDEILRRAKAEARKSANRLLAPYRYLIFCEGTKTEPNYFKRVKAIIEDRYKNRITIQDVPLLDIEGTGRSCLSLLHYARNFVAETKNNYNYIWLVFDKDDFPCDDFDNTIFATEENNRNPIQKQPQWYCAWSNQCIELWFLLHFEYYCVDHERSHYIQKLNEIFKAKAIGSYEKNLPDIFNILTTNGDIDFAIKNAIRLNETNRVVASKRNPSTNVHLLMNDLLPYLRE